VLGLARSGLATVEALPQAARDHGWDSNPEARVAVPTRRASPIR
jgi:hypothetical protein